MSTPVRDFEVVDETFIITEGAACPLFECASEDDARMAKISLNALLKVAREAAAFLNDPAARPLGCLPAEADDLIDALLAAGLEVRA